MASDTENALSNVKYSFEFLDVFNYDVIHFYYPRDAMLARVIEIATCLSVCPSVRHAPVLCQNEES